MLRALGENGRTLFKKPYNFKHQSISIRNKSSSSKSSGGKGTLVTIGTLALASGGVIAYAKYDNDFRDQLVKYVPFTDNVIKYVFQENKDFDILKKATVTLDNVKKSITSTIGIGDSVDEKKPTLEIKQLAKKKEPPPPSSKPYEAPPPVIPVLEQEKMKPPEEKFSEIRIEKKNDGAPRVLDAKHASSLPVTHPKNLAELEKEIRKAATEAVNTYNAAIYKLQLYNLEVENIISSNVNELQPQTWASVRTKAREKDEYVEEAKSKAEEAISKVSQLKDLLSHPTYKSSDQTKESILLVVEKIQKDIDNAKCKFEVEKKLGSVTEKYWRKVECARKHFSEQLESLFPAIDINRKKLQIDPDDLDLFLLYAYSNVLFYQKELSKLETMNQVRLDAAVKAAKENCLPVLTNAQICAAVEEEKRRLTLCFQQECMKLKQEAEAQLREQLKRQSQCFTDHLDDAVKTKTMEIERELGRKFDELLECERTRYKMQLAAIVGRLKGLDQGLKAKVKQELASKNSQLLWNASQSLYRALKTGCPGVSWREQLRPLETEICSIHDSASNDEFVVTVLKTIPSEARNRGVFPEPALRERFLKVEQMARNVALVPEKGGSLLLYCLSFMQSFLMIKEASPIPAAELNDEEVDLSKLSTNDILQRARYWLDRGNLLQTLKYMNLLKGASRRVACQWMNETRILLETQQAAETLMAHASHSGYASF